MSVQLLTEHHNGVSKLKMGAAQARLNIFKSKCHIVAAQMIFVKYVLMLLLDKSKTNLGNIDTREINLSDSSTYEMVQLFMFRQLLSK